VTKRDVLAVVVIGLSLVSLGQVREPAAFTCRGEHRGALCWLSDAQLRNTATWWFANVLTGTPLSLTLEGTAHEICETCQVGRDVLVRVFYRAEGDTGWQRVEMWLRNVAPDPDECLVTYPVRGTARIISPGPDLVVMVQRILTCAPHVGFAWGDLTLGVPALPPVVVPPPPPPPPVPPPPPPPPPPACPVGPEFRCVPGSPPEGCLLLGVDLATVARETLPESFGPGNDAIILDPGHYMGSLGDGDYHDWYRIRTFHGQPLVVWLDPGDLIVDMHLIHDPCGDILAQCLNMAAASTMLVPCHLGVYCPALNECFLGGECWFFIRVVRRSGTGPYRLSILTGTPNASSP